MGYLKGATFQKRPSAQSKNGAIDIAFKERKIAEKKRRPQTGKMYAATVRTGMAYERKRNQSGRRSMAQLVEDQKGRHQQLYDSMTRLQETNNEVFENFNRIHRR